MSFKRYFKYLILLFFITWRLDSFSQEYSYVNYDTRDGLAGSVVYDAIQDKEGFMWFATENGLSRFDGKDFKTFTTKDGLPDNEILRLFVDSKGRLWIMPFKSSLCYYYKGKIYNKNNDSLLSKITMASHPFDMAEDKSGNLFVAETDSWHIIFNNGNIKSIYGGPLAVGINKNGQAQLLTTVSELHPKLGISSFIIISPIEKKEKKIVNLTNWSDLNRSLITPEYILIPSLRTSSLLFYKDSKIAFSLKTPLNNTVSISYINDRKIVFNTRSGIKLFDPQTKSLSELIFKDFSITSAYQDKENNFWLTTSGSGILMIPSFQFRNHFFLENRESKEISALYLKGDTVYGGGWSKKIWKININTLLSTYQLASYHEGTKLISLVPVHNKIFPVFSGFCSDPINEKTKTVFNSLSMKSANTGKSGVLFATNANSVLCRWSGKEENIWLGRTTSAIEKDSGFYIGTLNGLYYKSYKENVVDFGKLYPVFTSRIVNLAISPDNILWVTTKGNGVAACNNNKIIHHFTEADGLTSDNCISIYIDSNVVWLGTEKGLNRIEISGQRSKITRFTMSDGLPSNIINAIVAKGNKVFVGTPKGLTYFEVDKISQTSACDLQLTGIYVANKYWAYDSAKFSLPHKNNDVRFEFSGISFKSAGEMMYKYRLLGLQPEWRTTTEKQLSFPSLSSGKYSLQLIAINKYGVESKTKEIRFTIEKLFWQKTWFRLMSIFLLAGGIWAFVAYRIKKIRQKEKKQTQLNQRIAELEQKALRSQMNPHFIFNCLNSIQQFVGERDITGANNFITDFSRLIRMTLDLSTHTLINMNEEIEYITTYLKVEKARLEDQFNYRINIDSTLDLHEIYLPPLLLQPYVENSIRHGIKYKPEGDGLIQINVEKKDSNVLISIEDNGIGREAAKKYNGKYHIQYQSRGMAINEDRIKILNNFSEKKIQFNITDLYNSEKEAVGTRVDIYLL